MNDLLPSESPLWQYIERTISDVLRRYGYREIRFPLVEPTALFERSIGEVTDIVAKEMYTFADRNGDSITLRPEGTAGCVRACLQHGLLDNQQLQRLWYCGPMFRYEKPQKGRLRQFHQVGVECFGMASADIDAELIALTARLWRELDIAQHLTLEINTIGSAAARAHYRQVLVDFLQRHRDRLDSDSQRRIDSNPLRVLDSKHPATQAILDDAPLLSDYLDEHSVAHFERFKQLLEQRNIAYRINPRLVRGLDYYSDTVFEWTTDQLGAQNAVCAGGRYDSLVTQLGGKPVAATGFALGLERLCLLLQVTECISSDIAPNPDIYYIAVGERARAAAFVSAEQLRDALPTRIVQLDNSGGSFKSQFKKADKSGAQLALIIGDREVEQAEVAIKWLRCDKAQQTVPLAELSTYLRDESLLSP